MRERCRGRHLQSTAAGSEPQPEASCAFPSAITSDNRLPGTKNEAPAMTDIPLAVHAAALALRAPAVEATRRYLHAQVATAKPAPVRGAGSMRRHPVSR